MTAAEFLLNVGTKIGQNQASVVLRENLKPKYETIQYIGEK